MSAICIRVLEIKLLHPLLLMVYDDNQIRQHSIWLKGQFLPGSGPNAKRKEQCCRESPTRFSALGRDTGPDRLPLIVTRYDCKSLGPIGMPLPSWSVSLSSEFEKNVENSYENANFICEKKFLRSHFWKWGFHTHWTEVVTNAICWRQLWLSKNFCGFEDCAFKNDVFRMNFQSDGWGKLVI
jgi:hypothetical protein